jgi:hypothetical protein
MRGANAYQTLNDTHERLGAETNLPGSRYEALRETQQQLDVEPLPEPLRLIDILEKRRAELDRELSDLREAGRGPEPGARARDEQADIDRALGLQPEDASPDDTRSPSSGDRDIHVAPEQWSHRGGMVEQQASAREWFDHANEVRRAGQAGSQPEARELSQEDRELLAAARATEEETRQPEQGQSHIHDPGGP